MRDSPQLPPRRERTYLRKHDVLVTSTRLVVPPHTFAISDITSVRYVVEPPRRRPGTLLFGLAGLAIVTLNLWLDFREGEASTTRWDLSLVYTAVFLAVAAWEKRKAWPTYYLLLGTSGGEVRALADRDGDWVRHVGHAALDAVSARG